MQAITLQNGATVIDRQGSIVLANYHGEWVVWTVVDSKGHANNGHYFQGDFRKAAAYYLEATK